MISIAFAARAAVCLVLCLILAGCGTVSEEDYPPLEKVDLSSMTLGTVSNSTFSTQYPADKWTGSDGTSPLIIYYNDTQGTGQAVNINAQQSGTYSGKFTEKYMNKLTESITESLGNEQYNGLKKLIYIIPVICIIIAYVVIVLFIWIRLFMSRSIVKPILMLSDEARRISMNDYSGDDIIIKGDDEISLLI